MAYETLALTVLSVLIVLYRYLNQTDIPKIRGLPEIPGIPIFGNLIQLGDRHAKVAGEWAKKYGPVFQVRMGNKVNCITRERSRLGDAND
jgi:phenylacetate 2-hydroxylase